MEILNKIKSVKLCLMAYPNNEIDSEFEDRISDLEEIENELSKDNWIKIESEDDLPKKDMECFYVLEIPERYSNAGKKVNIGSFKFGKNIMSQQENYFTMDNFFYHRFPSVTHYQPIIKPNAPTI